MVTDIGFEEQQEAVGTVTNCRAFQRAAATQLWQIVGTWEQRPIVTRFPPRLK